ncbi:ABC transporter substrate-binding protein [Halomonas nitroreducens]|uniref:ABC transporter substrate-binding protein n=1 Tax=Halomonas nitroreducens TaxID=447425 RepID=A0A431V1G1_9GAMM|nr:ABC transporter substrate-binding protein [Halomonas nitroreducens]RTR00222.1 ABC transporter substrate-binding protein [Halomonas nitroreducens]
MRSGFATLLLLWLCAAPLAMAEERLHYPAAPVAGQATGQLVIHGALDLVHIRPLLERFHRQHPGIELTYRNLGTLPLYERFLATPDEVDVLISSAMPWQYRLANDGHAQPLGSAAAAAWPDWARWRQELFAFTFEPVVMVVRRELIERFGRPQSHADLLALLQRHGTALAGRVVTYDPSRSGAGYTYAIEESRLSPRYWDLVAAFGQTRAQLVDTTGEMLAGLAEGRYWLGYNLLGSYARRVVAQDPALEMVIPDDYALVTQRLALMPRQAPHPRSARRFLDFLIGLEGQRVIAEQTALGAVHPELEGQGTADRLRATHGEALRPLALGPGLLATLDDLKRQALLARWRREFSRDSAAGD